jgi:hypothetical protein
MANERNPSNRQKPDDEPTDEWDDLLDDDLLGEPEEVPEKPVSRPVRSRKQSPTEEPAEKAPPRKKPARKEPEAAEPTPKPEKKRSKPEPEPEEEENFRPEELEGAERTKDGLIRVKEGAPRKSENVNKEGKGKQSWVQSLGIADYIGLAASLAIFIGLASMLLTWMYGQEWGAGPDRADAVPELPVAGKLFKVTSIDSYWRRRADTDRAPNSEIIIPEVTIEVEAVGSTGYLSILFLEPSGTMSADPGNLTLDGGQISVRENEGRQDGPKKFTFTSTKGYTFEPEFRSYISLEEMEPWTIEIVETQEFGSDDSKRLAFFEIARDARTKEESVVTAAAAE